MDPAQKKLALRAINYGLHVMTAADGDELSAAGVNWVTQVSFEPPLVAVGCKADSHTCDVVNRTGGFAINVLGEEQLDIGKAFFRTTEVADGKINGYSFEVGAATGSPLLVDTSYWFEARVTDTIARGDHTVFIAEVVDAGVRDESVVPLLLRSTGMNYGG